MSSLVSGISGGQPSTTQPIAIPWLSPKVVTRNMWPKVLWDIWRCSKSSVLTCGNAGHVVKWPLTVIPGWSEAIQTRNLEMPWIALRDARA